jgi:hypothetical protein
MNDLFARFSNNVGMCGKCRGLGFREDQPGHRNQCNLCGGSGVTRNRQSSHETQTIAPPNRLQKKSLQWLRVHRIEAKASVEAALSWLEACHLYNDFNQVVIDCIWKTDYFSRDSIKACSAALDYFVSDLAARFPEPALAEIEKGRLRLNWAAICCEVLYLDLKEEASRGGSRGNPKLHN